MNNSLVLVLIGSIALGFAEAFNGNIFKKYKDLKSTALVFMGSVMHFILTIAVIVIFKIPFVQPDWKSILMIIFMGMVSYYANKLFYGSLKTQEASISTLTVMSSIVVTTILGRILFAEQVGIYQWLGIILVLISVFIVNAGGLDRENLKQIFKPNKATKFVLISAFLYALYATLLKLLSQEFDPYWFLLMEVVFTTPIYFLFDGKEIVGQIKFMKNNWKVLLALAFTILFYFVYNTFRMRAFEGGLELPIVDAVDNFVIFVIIFFEVVLFKVKQEKILLKVLCSILAVVGVLMISLLGS